MDYIDWIHKNCKFAQQKSPLYMALMQLRPQIARAAQGIYDAWEQDENNMDEEYGVGGICDEIAGAVEGIVSSSLPDVEVDDYGFDGDDHASKIVSAIDLNTMQPTGERYLVDIPYSVYEQGGGYNWKKIPNVVFTSNDVQILKI